MILKPKRHFFIKWIKIFFLLIVLVSCQDNTDDRKLEFIENWTFQTGFFSGNAQIEEFNNTEYVCFGDYNTHKKIALHDLNSTAYHEIDLKNITNLNEKILAFEIINLDTISFNQLFK